MELSLDLFKILLEKNPRYKKDSAAVIANRLGVSVELIKEYRDQLKEEKRIQFEGTIDRFPGIPSEFELEQIGFKQEANKRVPTAPDNFTISSYKILRDGTIGETWVKAVDNKETNIVNEVDWNNIVNKVTRRVVKYDLPKFKTSGKSSTKFFMPSDFHIGMRCLDWSLEKATERLLKILDYTDNCEEVIIANFGDLIDGWSAKTATSASNHTLPQNMNNEEQVIGAVNMFQTLFDGLAKQVDAGIIKSFKFISVQDSNHSGQVEVIITKFLKMWLDVKYPNVSVEIPTTFWGHLKIRNTNILYSHGKNSTNMFKGVPLNLDYKTEILITQKLNEFNIPLDPKNTLVITGDLHQKSFNQGKFFKYYKLPSFAYQSEWVKDNFGDGVSGIQYLNIFNDKMEEGLIEF